MSRFTFSACALFLASGMFVACEDELLTGTPSWLGSSIYDELAQRGNFQTTLRLINDPEVSTLNADGQTEYRRLLGLTGSKTLFVADDEAYARFFESNDWGVKRYEDLSQAQKRTLFKSSMVNSAYLIELLSSQSTGNRNPREGAVMRRETERSLYDSIPVLFAEDMPDNNKYWAYYRDKYPKGSVGMTVMRDNSVPLMSHYIEDFMRSNQITDDDLNFLTNGACTSISEAYINGQRVKERDVTCQNGYIHVVENVMTPLGNMAEAIRNDKDLSIFSRFMDRFSVPYPQVGSTTENGDTVFVWRYFNDTGSHALTTSFQGEKKDDVLPFDPGWNAYTNEAATRSVREDMGVILAPTNAAINAYFASKGKAVMDRFKEYDNIPDDIIINMMDNFMKYSLVSTVPSKFSTVTNTAQMKMGLTEDKVDSCIMTNNGVVYKMNEVLTIPEYQSVAFPASLDEDIRIMRTIINNEELGYRPYLNSMETEYILILPSDKALANYVDPVDFCKQQKTITEFYYDDTPKATQRVKARRYNAVEVNGRWERGTQIEDPWYSGSYAGYGEETYVINRLRDVLENSIFVKDSLRSVLTGENVYVSKGGCPVILEGSGQDLRILSPYNKELAGYGDATTPHIIPVRPNGYYSMGKNPDGNGETFVVDDEAMMPTSKSVPTILGELAQQDERYSEFSEMVNNSTLATQFYDYTAGEEGDADFVSVAKSVSNGLTLSIMENYNYTIYVPPTSEIRKLYKGGLLPDWRERQVLEDQLAAAATPEEETQLRAQIDEMNTQINNFIRYHVQNNAIYLRGGQRNGPFETSYMGDSRRFAALEVAYDGADNYTVTCMDDQRRVIANAEPRHVVEGNYFSRDYHFRFYSNPSSSLPQSLELNQARHIYNYSSGVIHLLDKPLLYSQELSDAYNRLGN